MKRQASAVFWDMDGTLIDTEDLHHAVIRDWCAEHGYALDHGANADIFGKTMPEKWRILAPRLGSPSSEDVFRAQCEERYIEQLTRDKALERSLSVVRELALRGVMQACVSNGEAAVVRANVEILGLSDVFAFVVTGEDVTHGKPAPDPYVLAAEKAGCRPEECIAVEDSPVGMAAARAAGCIVCGWPLDGRTTPDMDYLLATGDEFPFHLLD